MDGPTFVGFFPPVTEEETRGNEELFAALEAVEPEPSYLVELCSGDARIEPQSSLRPLADDVGA